MINRDFHAARATSSAGRLAVAALIDGLVQSLGWRAIVIGGLAVEFWTRGAYSTSDIDLYLPCDGGDNQRMRRIRFADWLKGREAARKRAEQVERGFAEPYRRERPRDRKKARLLRERGTPEHLIGPERADDHPEPD